DFAADAGRSYSWNDNDCLLTVTDDNTNTTAYAYDSLNRLTSTTQADRTQQRLIWSPRSNLIQSTDPNGTVINCTYDLNDRCTRKDIIVGSNIAATTTFELFQYDGASQLVMASNDISMLNFEYDSLGYKEKAKQDCLAVARAFDAEGNCLSLTYPSGRVVNYAYDALNQLSNVTSTIAGRVSQLAAFGYDGPGR